MKATATHIPGRPRAPSRRRSPRAVVLLLVVAVLPLLACDPPPITPTNNTNFVVLGDSLSAGHMNACTVYDQQDSSYAKVIARQAGWRLDMPYLSAPGARPCMIIQQDHNLLSIRRQPVPDPDGILPEGDPNDDRTWGTRLDPDLRSGNLSSPGTRIVDVFAAPPAPWGTPPPDGYHWLFELDYEKMWRLFADTPDHTPDQSLLEQAVARINRSSIDRDVVVMWLVANDILWSAFAGSVQAATPVADFATAYNAALGTLAATGAEIVVANMPDLTVTPHFLTAEQAVGLFPIDPANPTLGFLTLDMVIDPGTGATVGQLLGLSPGDYVPFSRGLPKIAAILQGVEPGPLPQNPPLDDYVLTPTDIAELQQRIADYNAIIAAAAATYGAVLVDVNGLLADADQFGYPVGSETLTTDFCGGIFSLDGVHPSKLGYTAVANEFIRTMNARLPGMHIPPANEVLARHTEFRKNRCLADL